MLSMLKFDWLFSFLFPIWIYASFDLSLFELYLLGKYLNLPSNLVVHSKHRLSLQWFLNKFNSSFWDSTIVLRLVFSLITFWYRSFILLFSITFLSRLFWAAILFLKILISLNSLTSKHLSMKNYPFLLKKHLEDETDRQHNYDSFCRGINRNRGFCTKQSLWWILP